MPEGPEVHIFADRLKERLVNKHHVLGLYMDTTSTHYSKRPIDNLSQFKADLNKTTITDIKAIGKRLIFELSNGWYIISFLGMTGHWTFEQEKHSNLWLNLGEQVGKYKILDQQVWFTDMRHHGTITLTKVLDLKVGIDIITKDIDDDTWLEFCKLDANKQLCQFLMNQERFAGVGNYLKAEILYIMKLNPSKLVKDLTQDDKITLKSVVINLVRKHYKHPDTPIFCYNRKEDVNGYPIITQVLKDGRTTHWCPTIQQ